ncbi:ABC transporter permease [Mangrovactinospora gilvigrisea]|uniref:ABC transporter permease n=1 Tax=Mangrovactinospora gilvigrisea TaxID=1428644 RepID=A0A1J7C5P2_9ACTN|nr:carbohydrate ABC transporter permease [Mangrovactinospora gilvigrisea]OIV36864.1 ABC transporter permease [Mangrovactinospora gilvigrisea]
MTARKRSRNSRGPGASAALHLTLAVASLCAVFPVLWLLYLSFGPSGAWASPGQVLSHGTLGNYADVLFRSDFPKWFLNTVIIAGGTTAVGVFLAATTGYAVSRMRFPGRRPLMWSFLITQMFPMIVLIVPLYRLMTDLGLLDSFPGMILVYSTISVPFCAWMLKGYFDTIPVSLDEAGQMDGLTPFGTFYRIVLPLARPGLAVTAFFNFMTAWAEVAYASQFLSADHFTLAVGIGTFAEAQRPDWALMTAAAVIITIPAAVVYLLVQRHMVSGLVAGGTKS